MVPELNAGMTLLLGDRSCSWNVFGTAAWKTKSVISSSVLLEACIVITVTLGLVFDLSKVKSIFSPFLLYAVIEGIPAAISLKRGCDESPSSKNGGCDIWGAGAGVGEPVRLRSPRRSRSSPPAEAGLLVGAVGITGVISFPPNKSNKSFAWLVGCNPVGGGLVSRTAGSVSPLVCTISVGPFVVAFSITGILSSRAGFAKESRLRSYLYFFQSIKA